MSEKSILRITKTKKNKFIGKVILNNKEMTVPYPFKDDKLNNKPCDVERDKGLIVKCVCEGIVLVDKTSYSPNNASGNRAHGGTDAKMPVVNPHAILMEADNKFQDSFDIEKTKLPSDTKDLKLKDIDNFNLKFNKAARYENDKQKFSKDAKHESGKFKFYNIPTKRQITHDGAKPYKIKFDFANNQYKSLEDNIEHCIKKQNMIVEEMTLKSDWRIANGIGSQSVYEVSLLLHHIYGIPYLSGQSIKGVVRSYIISECFDNDEKRALSDAGFRIIFGASKDKDGKFDASAGTVCFYDSFPISTPDINVDVMNAHFTKYYSQNALPTEYEDPNPVFFLTVSNADFKFIIASRKKNYEKINDGTFKDLYPIDVIKKYLPEALRNHGIGAKTAVGYGYMD